MGFLSEVRAKILRGFCIKRRCKKSTASTQQHYRQILIISSFKLLCFYQATIIKTKLATINYKKLTKNNYFWQAKFLHFLAEKNIKVSILMQYRIRKSVTSEKEKTLRSWGSLKSMNLDCHSQKPKDLGFLWRRRRCCVSCLIKPDPKGQVMWVECFEPDNL
jgi:hypothetical protein